VFGRSAWVVAAAADTRTAADGRLREGGISQSALNSTSAPAVPVPGIRRASGPGYNLLCLIAISEVI